ncbi:MAG: PilZ domain-containing protein [Myxococcales bacterium]|nr:MAG: PilZ domain-containing protein [Myxococcales bacterium]
MDNRRSGQRYEKRFEVILRHDGERAEGFLANLSDEGMEVRARCRFEMRDELSVRVLTPEGERFHYLSEVRWWRPLVGEKMGLGLFRYGLRLLAIDPEHERLMHLVRYDANRRQDVPRVFVELPALLDGSPVPKTATTVNLSPEGVFLKLEEAPPPFRDDRLTVRIDLPETEPVWATARVVHLLQAVTAQKLDLSPGVGLQFVQLSDDNRRRLAEFVERMKAAGKDEPAEPEAEETSPEQEP